jgi:histidyl-tRNA synthetase
MGYYTGPIFEIEHPKSGSSIGGGGRYDGMVGRWLGTDAPAVGISIGFERAVELVELDESLAKSVVLIVDSASTKAIANALEMQAQAIAEGYRVRIEQRPKKINLLLDSMLENGFNTFAQVGEGSINFADLDLRSIAN